MQDDLILDNTLSDSADEVYVFPVSAFQQGLWVFDQLYPGLPNYNLAAAVRLHGQLNVAALETSLNEIVRRHEVLRTTFELIDDEVSQVVALEMTLRITVIELETIAESDRKDAAKRLADEEAQRPFDLSRGPLLRITLLRFGEQEHVLLVTMHHIVSDGWSIGIFIREMALLYDAFSKKMASPLPDLPIQYADFAEWQRDRLQGKALDDQLAYWRQQLAAIPPALELPTDRPRPVNKTSGGAMLSLELSPSLSAKLKSLSQSEDTTLFMTLLATFQTLLFRLTGQDDIVVGSPIAGRDRSQTSGLIGFFVNTVVLRTNLAGTPTFRELLGRVRKMTLDAFANQEVPFELLVEALHSGGDGSRTPLFHVYFNMLNFMREQIELAGLAVEIISVPEIGSKFDLTLYVKEESARINLELLYDNDLFDQPRMAEMLQQLNCLLSQVVDDPDREITGFSLVTESASKLLPNPFEPLCPEIQEAITEHFTRQARRAPHRLAVTGGAESWTYNELEARSNQIAHYLHANGVGAKDIVAIYGHRSPPLVVAIMGILKAGAAFTILDPVYPAARLIDCLRVAMPKAWIQMEEAGLLPSAVEEAVSNLPLNCKLELPPGSITAGQGLLAKYPVDVPAIAVTADDIAYISFTSGTTGEPKAIVGTHGPLSHFVKWHSRTFQLHENDRFAMLSGLSHDPLLRDIFTPLCIGAALYIPDPQLMGATGWLAGWLQRRSITVIHLTPPLGRLLTRSDSDETIPAQKSRSLVKLRYAFFGGETLMKKDADRLKELAPSITCVNFYGATETPQAMGYFVIAQNEAEGNNYSSTSREVVPLGKGIDDAQLLILNSSNGLAGIG